jgi:hypothetical protein
MFSYTLSIKKRFSLALCAVYLFSFSSSLATDVFNTTLSADSQPPQDLRTPQNGGAFVRHFDRPATHLDAGNSRDIRVRNQTAVIKGVMENNKNVISRGAIITNPAMAADGEPITAITAGNGINLKALDAKVIIDLTMVNRGNVLSDHQVNGSYVDSHVGGNVVVTNSLRSQIIQRIDATNSGTVRSIDAFKGGHE